jgi:hypothetical protein
MISIVKFNLPGGTNYCIDSTNHILYYKFSSDDRWNRPSFSSILEYSAVNKSHISLIKHYNTEEEFIAEYFEDFL